MGAIAAGGKTIVFTKRKATVTDKKTGSTRTISRGSSSSSRSAPTLIKDTIKVGGKVIVGFTNKTTGAFSPSGTEDNQKLFTSVSRS